MAPVSPPKRKPVGTRTPKPRPKAPPTNEQNDGPPPKKRRYVPGGPGGGGRYVDVDGTETPAGGVGSGYNNNPGSRGRSGREGAVNGNASARLGKPKTTLHPAKHTQLQTLQTAHAPGQANHLYQVGQTQPSTLERARPTRPLPSTLQHKLMPPKTPTPARPKREKAQGRPRYTSASAAAMALAHGDGYKPREERGWEEFHPDLDIEVKFPVFGSEEVDGIASNTVHLNGGDRSGEGSVEGKSPVVDATPNGGEVAMAPAKRRPGRPRRRDSMLNGIVSPVTPKTVPPPGPNPRERLTLPKPAFQMRDPFIAFEQKGFGQQNYVDRTMASVGYQESDVFVRNDKGLIRMTEVSPEEDLDLGIPTSVADGEANAAIGTVGVGRVEYDMDEQDEKWLETYNAKRKEEQFEPIKPAIFEITMTKIEKEWHALEKRIPKPNPKPPQTHRPRSSSAAAVNGESLGSGEEQDSKCAICDDGDCENSNAIVFCDGCDLAVHQECYGVPFIPEGQWLCRKCQLIGRGSPSCIFCPNTEGAFKQTNTSKWSHLLCAIWIPEVSIGNPSLMEPVNDVEKVPRSRWKLVCYICKQKMGASIQCGNKNCFVAFHVTCARRAHLYLKMKPPQGGPTIIDSSLLKAFCDKHVPPDWRIEHSTDAATAEALEYYRDTMQGKQWGDSMASALSLGPSYPQDSTGPAEDENYRPVTPRLTLTVGGNKRKRPAPQKAVWKLPSGAPVIPQVVLNSVIASLQRFTVRQRKQYAEDACKYWTLKREARRGAALLKRLQLQLETFSSMEMTRRNFPGMGAAGGVRLQRRIEFAERLYRHMDKLRILCDEVRKREKEKLKDVETLKGVVDLVYFPIPPILWPILERAQTLDGKGMFRNGLLDIRSKLADRNYTSVSRFSADLASVFTSEIGVQSVEDTAELQMQISGRAPELSLEQREKRKLAKRIIKAIQPALEDALKKESELSGKPFEKELKGLDVILESSVQSRRGSLAESTLRLPAEDTATQLSPAVNGGNGVVKEQKVEPIKNEPGVTPGQIASEGDISLPDADASEREALKSIDGNQGSSSAVDTAAVSRTGSNDRPSFTPTTAPCTLATQASQGTEVTDGVKNDSESMTWPCTAQPTGSGPEPPTPQSFETDKQLPLAQGGIQWYMQPFDPIGTTIHEERWTGREVLRGMSEELSEIDEDDLRGLVDHELENGGQEKADGAVPPAATEAAVDAPKPKVHRTRRRWRGFK